MTGNRAVFASSASLARCGTKVFDADNAKKIDATLVEARLEAARRTSDELERAVRDAIDRQTGRK
jgi:hypothetical protein